MATEAQVVANRSNAQKSTGPRTPEGKAVVAQNAVQQGLLARAAVLQGEDWEEYTCYHEEMFEELYPDGMQEEELAARIVDLSWRLRRARRYQDAVFEALYDTHAAEATEPAAPPDPGASVPSDPVLGRMLLADFSGARVLERVLLYERRIESSLYRARAELRQLRRQPLKSARRGPASFDKRWEDSGGYRPVSSLADGDFTLETADSALATEDPLCETNPIYAAPRSTGTPLASFSGQALPVNPDHGRDAHATVTPDGVTTNPTQDLLCETNPICEATNGRQVPFGTGVMNDSAQNGLGKTNPISPSQGQAGGWPTGLLVAGSTPGREFSGNALFGEPTIVYS